MDENKYILLVSRLQAEIVTLKQKNVLLMHENSIFSHLRKSEVVPNKTTKLRVDGQPRTGWGVVLNVVRKHPNMTAREIVKATGFNRYAVYAAAKRGKIKLRPAFEKRPPAEPLDS